MLLLFNLIPVASGADLPFHIRVETGTSIELSGDKIVWMGKKSSTVSEALAKGTESSSCEPYGRQSAAQAAAWSEVIESSENSISLRLKAEVRANGGHFRTCLIGCALGKCLGIHGNDTQAKASALANAVLAIEFSSEFPPADYELDFAANSDSAAFTTELKDSAGNILPLRRKDGSAQILRGRPGAVYFLTMGLPLSANDAGGCCSDEKSGSSAIKAGIRIQRAPILDARGEFVPFIGGGNQTTAYPYVGALKIENKLHCTATVIGSNTILTAAHCVHGFESRLLDSGVFLTGSNISQPSENPIAVAGFDFPVGPGEMQYDPKTYKNDIAIIYLKSATAVKPAGLHNGVPSWDDIINKKISLTFVGFGYDVVDGQKVAAGIKRESSWFINNSDFTTVSFGAADKGTCKGDSGGPAFLIEAGKILQVAITSGSYSNSCKDGGVETRVDYFLPWITARLK